MTDARPSPSHLLCRVSFEDIEILGHWCGAHIVKSYLTGLLLPACLVRAGHFEDAFILPRGRILPPQHLQNQIFPGLQDALKHWQVCILLLCMAATPCCPEYDLTHSDAATNYLAVCVRQLGLPQSGCRIAATSGRRTSPP